MLPRLVLNSWVHVILPPQPLRSWAYRQVAWYMVSQSVCLSVCLSVIFLPEGGTQSLMHGRKKCSTIKLHPWP
jgi:hypothetical protein